MDKDITVFARTKRGTDDVFLLAASRCGVPAACVLGIANMVGPDAHESWRRNATSASASAVAVVEKWIAGLA